MQGKEGVGRVGFYLNLVKQNHSTPNPKGVNANN